ncbi:helix-turn-helix transcriptional regulator [Paenarthrobacter sp. YAF11_1]|uniref:helix-turn-helix transcriptional regulator n=1 Tax=Paenarthrobacter sp. YAF11_1 TaxID=3233074 RepID=UPI003F96E474
MNQTEALRMTLSDVAALAQVQRPVVSMWRKRSAGSAHPFPKPVALNGRLELFDSGHIAAWLTDTGRGNNREAANDVAAFTRMPGMTADGTRGNTFETLTALLTLKAITGNALTQLTREELLDAADECDPDDTFLYSEMEAAGTSLVASAAFTDRLVDSAYNVAGAFEHLLAARFRDGLKEYSATALTDSAVGLVAAAVVELAATLGGNSVFADSTRGGSDLLLGVAHATGEAAPVTFMTADDDGASGRLVRRRLRVHGVDCGQIHLDPSGEFAVQGPVVHVAQYPSPGESGMDGAQILAAVEQLLLQMDDQQRAVIIGPARVLCDPLTDGSSRGLRAELLRIGRVRAIVRLPQGLLRAKPREAQALWVMGPSFSDVPIAERWTMVADLSTQDLTEDVKQDLVSDIVASMGNGATVRAHSFRFARLVQTRHLLVSRKSLVPAPPHRSADMPNGAEAALRVEELARLLQSSDSPALHILPTGTTMNTQTATVQELISAGTLMHIKGNRVVEADLNPQKGTQALGPAELIDPHNAPHRYIGLLDLAANYPSSRLTQPGDVVFCTSPRPAATVDTHGGSVVIFPAKILRVDAADPDGLSPFVVAFDINSISSTDKAWRRWRLRRVPEAQRRKLGDAHARLQHEQQQARERLGQLHEVATLITDGVASGSLTLIDPSSNLAEPQTKGTQ